MAGNNDASPVPAISSVAMGAIGLALMLSGLLLLDQAFSSSIFDRLVRHAWVAGVLGLLLLIPGSAVLGFAVQRALKARGGYRGKSKKSGKDT